MNMTDELFWELYNQKEIDVKCFAFIDNDDAPSYCEAYEWQGHYYLRLDINYIKPTTLRGRDIKYRMGRHFIKEFANKAAANAYFKKVFSDKKRVNV